MFSYKKPNIKSGSKMPVITGQLKAIVLDNDEATGSYSILFDLWETLQNTSLGETLHFHQILDYLTENIEAYNIFRPALFKFLDTAFELRSDGELEAIIMYTHQNAEYTWKEWSVPAFISKLMGAILSKKRGGPLQRELFDFVLSLPPEDYQKDASGGWVIKSFNRVLNLYPWKPADIRGILFIDDRATPTLIEADSVAEGFKDAASWYKVSPYRVSYGGRIYKQFIKNIAEYFQIELTMADLSVINNIALTTSREREAPTYRADDDTFIELEKYIGTRYRRN